MNPAYLQPLANHLWQSTLFAGVAGLLTLTLRENHARVRHWVWIAASCKFLIPLFVLTALGSQIAWRTTPETETEPPSVSVVMDEISRPFTAPHIPLPMAEAVPSGSSPLPAVLLSIWACGFIGIACRWWVPWRRMRTAVRTASPVQLEIPVRAVSFPMLMEPGVFGVFRPVLLLPEGIFSRLTPAQLEGVIAHELCHIKHRDNLVSAIHMFVETVFWFHPLVWWIGKRMVEERERACDEEVLQILNEPRAYAEGILGVCRLYAESPLACVSGITGSNLSKRIEGIMENRMRVRLNACRKLLLAGAGALALVGPLAIGLVNARWIRAQPRPAAVLSFDVASVKPRAPGDDKLALPTVFPGGRFASRTFLSEEIAFAYKLPFNPGVRLSGGPDWLRGEGSIYDIEATGDLPAGLSVRAREDRMRLMLQTLLADRFKLVIHRESKVMPVYALVAGKGGPKLERADIEEKDCPGTPSDTACHSISGGRGRGLHGSAVDMSDLVTYVENWTDRPLLDKTGIKGLFHIETKGWLPMQAGPPPAPGTKGEDGSDMADTPSLYAVFEQLGLKMEARKDHVDVYVIDHIEKPTPN